MHLWQADRGIIGYDEFAERWDRVVRSTAVLIIENNRSCAPIGFVQLYDINLYDGWAHFTVYVEEPFRKRGHGAEAVMGFLDYAFSHFNLRKIYAEVNGFNEAARALVLRNGFVEEGRLRDHVYWDGRFWDFYNLALYRDGWHELKSRTKLTLVVQKDLQESLGID